MSRLILILCMVFVGCAANQSKRFEVRPISKEQQIISHNKERDFKVSVFTNGKEVKDFETQLVHRINVTPIELDTVTSLWPKRLNLPFDMQTEKDRHGKVWGVKVVNIRSKDNPSPFGLLKGDVITAVGTRRTNTARDLWPLFDTLKKDQTSSMTIERRGRPHKILYYLTSN